MIIFAIVTNRENLNAYDMVFACSFGVLGFVNLILAFFEREDK
jgi:hypothetical protein